MSNERIDLTLEDKDGYNFENVLHGFDDIISRLRVADDRIPGTAAWCDASSGAVPILERYPLLLAELKRMYRLEDDYRNLLNQYWLDEGWTATCKADGEGECRLEIETLDELLELVANETVEIPEYSHSSDELILYEEHCTCGVTHEEWMISTGRASE
jgi:hypothetical protein